MERAPGGKGKRLVGEVGRGEGRAGAGAVGVGRFGLATLRRDPFAARSPGGSAPRPVARHRWREGHCRLSPPSSRWLLPCRCGAAAVRGAEGVPPVASRDLRGVPSFRGKGGVRGSAAGLPSLRPLRARMWPRRRGPGSWCVDTRGDGQEDL